MNRRVIEAIKILFCTPIWGIKCIEIKTEKKTDQGNEEKNKKKEEKKTVK